MKWQEMFSGGDYLAAAEFGDRLFTGKIVRVAPVSVEEDDGKTKRKPVVFFEGNPRGWMLCKTNAMCLSAMFGEAVEGWVGKSVTLFAAMVKVGKGKEPGIRVKGSSDLTVAVPATIKLPRRKPFTMQLIPTGKAAASPATANGAAKEREPTEEEIAAGEAKAKEEDV